MTPAAALALALAAWLACTPIDDPVEGRRVFQQEPCPPGERDIPLPPPPPVSILRPDPDPPAMQGPIPYTYPVPRWRHPHVRRKPRSF